MDYELTISIVAYHDYTDIKNAIMTIEKYTDIKLNKKIFIIDNGANNLKKNVVNNFIQYLSQYNDIEYIDTKRNLGFGKGHNYILNNINSKYHAIVNPDILLKEDSFSKIISYMDNRVDVGMVIPKIIDKYGNMQKVYRREPKVLDMIIRFFDYKLFSKRLNKITLQEKDFSKEFQVPFGQGSFLVIRTELFKKLNGFDDRYFMYMEDADLCKRVNQESKLMYFPNTEIIHLWEKGSHKNIKLFIFHIRSMIKYFLKWRKNGKCYTTLFNRVK